MIASLLLALQGSVVMVVLDDVGAKDLDIVSGNGFTPNIDYLKSCGIDYRNAHANPSCSPTRRSLLFGEYYTDQADLGCNPPTGKEPPLSLTSLPEALPMTPSGLVGKWHLGSHPGYPPWESAAQAHGFAFWRAGTPVNLGNFCTSVNYSNWLRVDDALSANVTTYNPRDQRDQAVQEIQDAKIAGEPIFLLVSLNLAHGPMHRPPANMLPAGYPATFTDRDKYEAMICAADGVIGALMAEVNLAEDCLIVVGDNGTPENMAPNPAKAKFSTYERGIKVPLVVATEVLGSLQGTESTRLTHVADLGPTIAQWFGETYSTTDGLSLFSGFMHTAIVCGTLRDTGEYDRCARGPRFKLRRFTDDQAQTEEFLFDLLLDPQESVNQLGNPSFLVQETWLRATLDSFEAR